MMILQVILEGIGLGVLLIFGLRHRYPQGRGGHGASLQPGGAGAVRNAGAYNTQKKSSGTL